MMIFCDATGGHINPAVTFGMFLARKISLTRGVLYIVAQCLGACTGAGLVKAVRLSNWRHVEQNLGFPVVEETLHKIGNVKIASSGVPF